MIPKQVRNDPRQQNTANKSRSKQIPSQNSTQMHLPEGREIVRKLDRELSTPPLDPVGVQRTKRQANFGPDHRYEGIQKKSKASSAGTKLPYTGARKRVFELKKQEDQCLGKYNQALRALERMKAVVAEKKAAYEGALKARKMAQLDFNNQVLQDKYEGLPPYDEAMSHRKSYYYFHDSIEEQLKFRDRMLQKLRKRRAGAASRSPDTELWESDEEEMWKE